MIARTAEERRLDCNYNYEASAGTGKTTTLVERIVEVLATGCNVEQIVAVTFTHAAAGEMKLRVRQELETARNKAVDLEQRNHLTHALQHLDRAFIGTIHSFCAQLLRRHPVEAEVDPKFQELSQPEALHVFSGVFRNWIERKLAAPAPALRRALLRLTWSDEQENDPLDGLKFAAWKLIEWRDHNQPWGRREYNRNAHIDEVLHEIDGLERMRQRCAKPDRDPLHRGLRPLGEFVARLQLAEAVSPRDYDSLESELLRLPGELRWVQAISGQFAKDLTRDEVFRVWELVKASISRFAECSGADLSCELRNELWELVGLYSDAKKRAGQLDFMDLLLRARFLLGKDKPRLYLQQRYRHLFIDEFQDTDSLQAEILLLLASADPKERDWTCVTPAPGKLFVVGDPKQSIYRFRRADAALYRRIANSLEARGVVGRKLTNSRRSVRPIQEFVNAAFAGKLEDYQPLEGGREPSVKQPSIIALPMPEPFGKANIAKYAINTCSPNAAAAFIEWLVNSSGWSVEDRDSRKSRPIKARDICILFRRFVNNQTDLTQEYVRCLEARGIAHVLVGSKSFHKREEIGTLRTALRAVEWPDDELSVFAVIRGSLFSLPDSTLLKFKAQFKTFHPLRTLPDDLDEEFYPIREALQLLAELHRERNIRPAADTINRLLEAARAHAGFAFRTGGERVLANVYRLCDLAREFESSVATSFRSFVEYLENEYDASEMSEAPVLEQQADGVKLMTVHRAKGLEFPVVILADLTANLTGQNGGDRYVDPDRSLCAQRLLRDCAPWEMLDHMEAEAKADRDEAHRLAYVAATRARDLLVVSVVGEKRFEDSWLSPLYDALYPSLDNWRRSARAEGCPPPRGEETVLNRPFDYGPDAYSIRPGLHSPVAGTHEVVWFDPAWLALRQEKLEGLANDELLRGTPQQVAESLAEYSAWKQGREEIRRQGQVPSFRVATATTISHKDGCEPETLVASDITRRSNRNFGRLVHSVLQHAENAKQAEQLCAVYSRYLKLSPDQLPSAIKAVRAAMEHPVVASATNALRQQREMPLVVRLEDGTLVEGIADLAYLDATGWTVVDYKTGSTDEARYKSQLRLYALALATATGQPVRAVLLQI